MIPEQIDAPALIYELNGWGMKDTKIEFACGFSGGYVAQIKCGNVRNMSFERGAKLLNLHAERKALADSKLCSGTSVLDVVS